MPATALDTRPSSHKLPDKFDADATEPASGRRHLVESCTEDGWGSTPSCFFGWMDSTSVGPLVHDVPLRWPRVVVRLFHHARDDPPPARGGHLPATTPTCPHRSMGVKWEHTRRTERRPWWRPLQVTMRVDATKSPTGVKRKQTRLSASCPKKQGAHLSKKEEARSTTGVDATEHGSRFQGE